MPTTSVLREFLYLDIDKVRAIAAQMYEGIVETATEDIDSSTEGGASLAGLRYQKRWGSSQKLEKSMADAIFPALELDLESLGILSDISDLLSDAALWRDLADAVPTGSMVRITGPAALFDARYFTLIMSSLISSAQGVSALTGSAGHLAQGVAVPPKAKTEQEKRADRKAKRQAEEAEKDPVGQMLPPGPIDLLEDSVSREQIVGMVKMARGLFSPGLHMTFYPTSSTDLAVSIRLEEGRRFLDSDPEVLFQRYGVQPQEWTVVGIVGHHGARVADPEFGDITDDEGSVSRGRTAAALNGFAAFVAQLGFGDLPRGPGFSLVPLAVYRVVPRQ